jgi:tRNA dimethylallyltransferase
MPIAILGPTASGKSALAMAVARRIVGTIVNGDPYQALAGLAIGTGQPDPKDVNEVLHAGYGALPLSTRPNPDAFGAWVRNLLASIERPVLVTGSGLYLRGIWDQLSELPSVDDRIVQKLRRLGDRLGAPILHRFLAAVDVDRAMSIHPNDGTRVQRALALHLATGQKPTDLLTGLGMTIPEHWKVLVVEPAREARRARVAARVAAQFAQGWPQEVAELLAQGHRENLLALRPLGYEALMGVSEQGLDAVRERIVIDTQAYAKRQSTWFRNQLQTAPRWDPDQESLESAFEKLGIS